MQSMNHDTDQALHAKLQVLTYDSLDDDGRLDLT